MIAFILGVILGSIVGVTIMAVCNSASKADSEMEKLNTK